jgi:hypothetical protein
LHARVLGFIHRDADQASTTLHGPQRFEMLQRRPDHTRHRGNHLEHDGTMAVAFSKECVGKRAGDFGEAEGDPVRECPWAAPARQ